MRRTAVILGVGAGLLIVAFVLWQNRSLFGDQFDIGDVRANEWVVEGFDQDGQTLVVSTFFGGVHRTAPVSRDGRSTNAKTPSKSKHSFGNDGFSPSAPTMVRLNN